MWLSSDPKNAFLIITFFGITKRTKLFATDRKTIRLTQGLNKVTPLIFRHFMI